MKKINLHIARFKRFLPVLSLLLLLLSNCSMFKPKFDPVGHQYAVNIQKEALALIGKAGESYSLHRDAVYLLMTRVERAYENARTKYKNDGVTGIWDVMRNPEANRLARFMLDWEKEDVLAPGYRKEATKLLQENFKLLIEIEESKKK